MTYLYLNNMAYVKFEYNSLLLSLIINIINIEQKFESNILIIILANHIKSIIIF